MKLIHDDHEFDAHDLVAYELGFRECDYISDDDLRLIVRCV